MWAKSLDLYSATKFKTNTDYVRKSKFSKIKPFIIVQHPIHSIVCSKSHLN